MAWDGVRDDKGWIVIDVDSTGEIQLWGGRYQWVAGNTVLAHTYKDQKSAERAIYRSRFTRNQKLAYARAISWSEFWTHVNSGEFVADYNIHKFYHKVKREAFDAKRL